MKKEPRKLYLKSKSGEEITVDLEFLCPKCKGYTSDYCPECDGDGVLLTSNGAAIVGLTRDYLGIQDIRDQVFSAN